MQKFGNRKTIEFKNGYPQFEPFAKQIKGQVVKVTINMTGNRAQDEAAALEQLMKDYNMTKAEATKFIQGFTWHHTEKVKFSAGLENITNELILVQKNIHNAFRHSGGVNIYNQLMDLMKLPASWKYQQ
ncbi:hypothetical protein AYO44_02230 [Planctomycetaceae bacterium SCGC AG-212-F19]|nr:hypothetical protein AYO44_02230 [Planctomycetaceae bacterium SCGC AG-212-F19]